MWEETGVAVRLTKLVGVFGGTDYIVLYPNGDITSYVTTVFEAIAEDGASDPKADEQELLEVRFVTEDEARGVVKTRWVSEVLEAVFRAEQRAAFAPPSWRPPA